MGPCSHLLVATIWTVCPGADTTYPGHWLPDGLRWQHDPTDPRGGSDSGIGTPTRLAAAAAAAAAIS